MKILQACLRASDYNYNQTERETQAGHPKIDRVFSLLTAVRFSSVRPVPSREFGNARRLFWKVVWNFVVLSVQTVKNIPHLAQNSTKRLMIFCHHGIIAVTELFQTPFPPAPAAPPGITFIGGMRYVY